MARKRILRMSSIVMISRIPRTLRLVKIPKILRTLILSRSRSSLIGNRPLARMQSTKDSRSVFSMVLKLLLKKVKFLIQYLEKMKLLISLFVIMKMKKYLKYLKFWKFCMKIMKSIRRMKNMT